MPLKLLDYGNPKPFGETVGRPRRLAWPVNVYRVTLPKVSTDSDEMNPFERVILKLIDAGGYRETKELAEEACLPESLVQCVLLRLKDKGYVDEYNQIIKQRRNKWSDQDEVQREFETACLFRELATGRILPYLQLMKDNPLKRKEDEETYYQRIRWNESHRNNPPTPRDVLTTLRAMQRRSMAFGSECRLPSVQLITIAQDAELYYLDCPIAIQKSDGEYRIADPFGNGFSLVLESAFGSLLEKDEGLRNWLMSWKDSLTSRKPNDQAAVHREVYENDANWARYPKLLFNLRVGRDRRFRSIEKIHAALEWALFYSCVQRPYAAAVNQLKLTHQSEHPFLLQKAAQKISLQWPPGGLFPVREGKLNDFLEGKADLGTVLSLSLLMAADDPSHPLRRIANIHPDFIVQLLKIKKQRDESGHGSDRARSYDVEIPHEIFMREVVTTLLPAIQFSHAPAQTADKEAISDALMDARTSVQSEFGFALFNRLGPNLQDRLIVAERFWLSCKDGDDALAFACDLYAAVQAAFRRSLTGALPPEIEDSEYIAAAKKNAEACALGELPECLLTVKRTAIRETLLGNDQTLQSCIVAFLLVSPTDVLNEIAQTHPSFISDLVLIIDRRGHGNEPLPLSKDDIRSLRKSAYTIIRTLLEA
jgi:hypothetical protein